jgi:hypothetical protein
VSSGGMASSSVFVRESSLGSSGLGPIACLGVCGEGVGVEGPLVSGVVSGVVNCGMVTCVDSAVLCLDSAVLGPSTPHGACSCSSTRLDSLGLAA